MPKTGSDEQKINQKPLIDIGDDDPPPTANVTPSLSVVAERRKLLLDEDEEQSGDYPLDADADSHHHQQQRASSLSSQNQQLLRAPRKPLRVLYDRSSSSQNSSSSVFPSSPSSASAERQLQFGTPQQQILLPFSTRAIEVAFPVFADQRPPARDHHHQQQDEYQIQDENACPRCTLLTPHCVCTAAQQQLAMRRRFTITREQVLLANNNNNENNSIVFTWALVVDFIARVCDALPSQLLLLFAGAPANLADSVDAVFDELLCGDDNNDQPCSLLHVDVMLMAQQH